MSAIFLDGFDHYTAGLQKWTVAGNATFGNAGAARTGAAGLLVSNTECQKQVLVAEEHATLILGFALKQGNTDFQARFRSDGLVTQHVTVQFTATGDLKVFRGTTGGTQLGSTVSSTIAQGVWCYVEIKVTLHDSTGAVAVAVNGATLLNLTGQDTKNAGTKTVLDGFGLAAPTNTCSVDDLYLFNGAGTTNNAMIGDVKVETLFPNGNGATSGLTGSDGNSTDNYLLVDETAPNTSDYTGSATNDQYDTYAMSNLATASGTVYGVAVYAYAAKSDAGAAGGAIMVRSGGTDYEKTDNALGTGYQYYREILELDPATSAAWTIANVNAAEVGFRKKAS